MIKIGLLRYSSITQKYSFFEYSKMVTLLYSRYFFYPITLLNLSNEISLLYPTLTGRETKSFSSNGRRRVNLIKHFCGCFCVT